MNARACLLSCIAAASICLGLHLAIRVHAIPDFQICPTKDNTTCETCCVRDVDGVNVYIYNPNPHTYKVCEKHTSEVCSNLEGLVCGGEAWSKPGCTGTLILSIALCKKLHCTSTP